MNYSIFTKLDHLIKNNHSDLVTSSILNILPDELKIDDGKFLDVKGYYSFICGFKYNTNKLSIFSITPDDYHTEFVVPIDSILKTIERCYDIAIRKDRISKLITNL